MKATIDFNRFTKFILSIFITVTGFILINTVTFAQPLPGGTLDPLTIPKYVTPLVIPPVMNTITDPATGQLVPNTYHIAVRQFKQQILPGGIWNTITGRNDNFPATTVWSYGPEADPAPDSTALGGGPGIAPAANSQFNYPAYTIETISGVPVSVRWINDLKDPVSGNYLPHLLPVDQTLHWANPPAVGCRDGTNRTDCATNNPNPYTGPVPIVTHVHGAHVDSHSDGYPEAWWLPAATNIPAGYATHGTLFDDSKGGNPGNLGYADYYYRNDQPATTLWYHDHALGITRLNVYAGPAGFWLIRGGAYDSPIDGTTGLPAILPGPAPVAGQSVLDLNAPKTVVPTSVRDTIREIPIVIQDRSFNADGSLFYPSSRAFFDGFTGPYVPDSDIAPTWNPEAFFNTMVVNGVTWPFFEVAPARYRLRILNGCNSRTLNLALQYTEVKCKKKGKKCKTKTKYLPFFQIGADQGFLPQVVEIKPGSAKIHSGTGGKPVKVNFPTNQQALLLGLAERVDVIVDFSKLPDGTVVQMINTAPDAPFAGFPDIPADPSTTGQVMQFIVNSTPASLGGPLGASPTDPVLADGVTPNPNAATDPKHLVLSSEPPLPPETVIRSVSLNEEESGQVCVSIDALGNITTLFVYPPGDPNFLTDCANAGGVPMAPKAALLGIFDPTTGVSTPLKWTDTSGTSTPVPVIKSDGTTVYVNVTESPLLGTTEMWEIYNMTVDAHPIHLHLVRYEVIDRQLLDPLTNLPIFGTNAPPEPNETGYKDTVLAYPGQVTRIKMTFDVPGLYVWHCHIVEHEDNEMMRPYVVQ